jgi:[acyl-carrier-protein] S-malonyltransferase
VPPTSAHVATVAGRPISVSELDARLDTIRRGPRGRHVPPEGGDAWLRFRRWVVQELVTEAVIAHEASATSLADGVGEPGAETGRLFELVTAGVTVPEQQVREYHQRNADLFRRSEARRIHVLVVPDERVARGAASSGQAGLDAAAQALELHRGEYAGPLEDAVFAAAAGEVVGPIQTDHGWQVVRVDAIVPEGSVPYEEASEAIATELLAAARARAFSEWLEQRRQALAVIEPAYEHPSHPVHGMPRHRH